MKINLISLFPKMFEGPFAEGMVARAIKNEIVKINFWEMRKWAWNNYGAVDDKPYGGGVGMLIRVDVIDKALKDLGLKKGTKNKKIILTSAKGKKFDQKMAEEWAKFDEITIICGRYEGFDERVSELVDEEVSIGDYVLTGGEIAATVMVDACVRLLPGVLGKDESSLVESFSEIEMEGKKVRIKEFPQYTRPAEYKNMNVPPELVSGDPKIVRKWQEERLKEGAGK